MAHQEPNNARNKNDDGHAGLKIGPHFKSETVAQLLSLFAGNSNRTCNHLAIVSSENVKFLPVCRLLKQEDRAFFIAVDAEIT